MAIDSGNSMTIECHNQLGNQILQFPYLLGVILGLREVNEPWMTVEFHSLGESVQVAGSENEYKVDKTREKIIDSDANANATQPLAPLMNHKKVIEKLESGNSIFSPKNPAMALRVPEKTGTSF